MLTSTRTSGLKTSERKSFMNSTNVRKPKCKRGRGFRLAWPQLRLVLSLAVRPPRRERQGRKRGTVSARSRAPI